MDNPYAIADFLYAKKAWQIGYAIQPYSSVILHHTCGVFISNCGRLKTTMVKASLHSIVEY